MSKGKILIVDDEENLRKLLARIIELEGYEVFQAEDINSGRKALRDVEDLMLVITDVKLPDGNGIKFLEEIKDKYPKLEVIVITAYGTIQDGVKAIKLGAFDYITKGEQDEQIIVTIERAIEKIALKEKVEHLQGRLSEKYGFNQIIGKSSILKHSISLAKKVSETDATVLILGETGTGKELFAQAIHYNSLRRENPFIPINCSAFPADLLESELFGHVKGSFTGAVKDKKGYFEEARGGTLFMDELGDMDLPLQAKLLRVLENKTFTRVGDTKPIKTDVRIIAATNKNLESQIRNGKFREDLFYRLNSFTITLPDLRDRGEDIQLIAQHFIEYFASKMNKPIPQMTEGFKKEIAEYAWPGNIRELRNVIERAIILSDGKELKKDFLPIHLHDKQPVQQGNSRTRKLEDLEKVHIRKVLTETEGNKSEAAKILGIGLTTLYRKLEKFGLEY